MPDVNDAAKLGSGKEMQERLPNLENAGIFSPATFPLSQITDEQGNQQGRTAKGDPGHTGESFIMHVCCIKDRFGRDWCQSGRIQFPPPNLHLTWGDLMRSGTLALGLLFVSTSCTKETTIPTDQTDTGSNPAGTTSSTRSTSVAGCPEYPDSPELARACIFDSNGKTYAEDGTVYVLPAAPPYGAVFAFQPGYFPLAEDAISVGPAAGVRAYAAPYDVQSRTQCCSEDNEANRIPAETVLDDNGVLTISVTNAEPQGDQIAIILDYGGLYRQRLTPANGGPCDLPSQDACSYAPTSGFAMRFYVGAGHPSQVTPSQPTAPSVSPDGTCLLEYNSALAAGEPCCYYEGGANTCDATVRCNERSGAGCCLLYGTANTSYGERCCLYANGGQVDGGDECAQLLATK